MYREHDHTARAPQVLPTVRLQGTAYFVDLARRQFRDTMNIQQHIDFDSAKGVALCRQAGVVTCLRCGMSAIVATSRREDDLRCMRCRTVVCGKD